MKQRYKGEGYVVVIGDRGMLGSEIVKCLDERGIDYIGLNTSNFNIANTSLENCVDLGYVNSVICTAAAHTLDNTGGSITNFVATNVVGPYKIAKEVYPKRFHFISTDYVFAPDTYNAWTRKMQNPICTYGFTKAEAEALLSSSEVNASIYRCGPMFGVNPCRGKQYPNIIERMVSCARAGQDCEWSGGRSNITYARDAANVIVDSVFSELSGYTIRHCVQDGDYSLYDVAKLVYRMIGVDCDLVRNGGAYARASLSRDPDMMMWDEAVVAYLKEAGHIVAPN